jgi:hypothetical protein
LAPSLIITELNDEIIKQLLESKNCRIDVRPIYEAAKLKKGEDKLDSILDIEFLTATAYNKHCDNDDRWRLWISFVLVILVPSVFGLGVAFIKHIIP